MARECATSDDENAAQDSEADRVTNNASPNSERRHSGLSAWGTLFTGLAALMTVFTAAATSYVAVVTYQDQQEQEAKDEEVAAADFAQRVEFIPGPSASMTLENPNDFPISNVVLSAAFYDSERKPSQQYFLLSSRNAYCRHAPGSQFLNLISGAQSSSLPIKGKWPTLKTDQVRPGTLRGQKHSRRASQSTGTLPAREKHPYTPLAFNSTRFFPTICDRRSVSRQNASSRTYVPATPVRVRIERTHCPRLIAVRPDSPHDRTAHERG
ncbi:hypothetical protein ACFYOV_07000 [Streptomyces sp. NPDC005931]|uniref:hypothetical protein n=1 Tax=Streptomyces sp. NPDC005931 TaxID=3364737 RepID=UPI0036951E22